MKFAIKNLLTAGAMLLCFSFSAAASQITLFTPANSVEPADNTHPVDAEAIVTTGNGTVTVQLFDLLTAAQMHDAGQLLSDFFFTLPGTFATVSNTNENTPSGTLFDINGSTPTATIGKWGFSDSSSSGSTTFHIDDLNNGNSPTQTIIGGTVGESSSHYTNANPSLTGNHNPFVQGEETFVLNIAGVTSNTAITSGVFSFGTDSGGNITGVPSTVPEPRTTGFIVAAGLVMAFALRRKKFVS